VPGARATLQQSRLAHLMTQCQRLDTQCHHLQAQSRQAVQRLSGIWEGSLQEWCARADQ
jgi:hypothetical protein